MLRARKQFMAWLLMIAVVSSPTPVFGIAASLPGGIVFPAFAIAGVVNPAALAIEWATVVHALYSPPLATGEAHNYLGSFATSNHKVGFNAGYTGSTYDTTTLHSAFIAAGYRKKKFSVGLSLHNPNITAGFSPAVNLGWILSLQKIRLGMVGYDLASTTGSKAGVGLGVGKVNRYNLEINLMLPHLMRDFQWGQEHTITITGALYLRHFGISLGGRYDKEYGEDGGARITQSLVIGAMLRVRKGVLLVGQYNSTPQSASVGIIFGYYPSENQKYGEYMDNKLGNLGH